jgi:hypothetical protein
MHNGNAVFVGRLGTGNEFAWVTFLPLDTAAPVHLDASADGNSIVVSGTFSGTLTDGQSNTIQSNGENGFVAMFDGSGNQGWTRALLPCAGASSTSIIASLDTDGSIGIAGTLDAPATLAGQQIGTDEGAPRFFVGRFAPNP